MLYKIKTKKTYSYFTLKRFSDLNGELFRYGSKKKFKRITCYIRRFKKHQITW